MSRELTALVERLERLALAGRALELEAERRDDPWFEHQARVDAAVAINWLRNLARTRHAVGDVVVQVDDDALVPPLTLAKIWIADEYARLVDASTKLHVDAAQRLAAEAEANAEEWHDGRRYAAAQRAYADGVARHARRRPTATAPAVYAHREARPRPRPRRRRSSAAGRIARARGPDEPEPPPALDAYAEARL